MSNGDLLIEPLEIDPNDFPPLPLQPGFTQLVSDELGNAATPTDGFDEVFAEVVAIVDALDSALSTLGDELAAAFGEADTIDAAPVSATADSFTASLGPSDTAVNNLGTLLGAAGPPIPTGGGGGGGTGGDRALPCEVTMSFAAGAALPQSQTFLTSATIPDGLHVVSKTFDSYTPGAFTATDYIPAVMRSGTQYAIVITQHTAVPAGEQARYVLRTAELQADVLCIHVGSAPLAPPSPPSPPPPGGPHVGGGFK
jgi:NAD(P)-dependent dehydrogenase (short-subunit alcohol dehydrogenase family)